MKRVVLLIIPILLLGIFFLTIGAEKVEVGVKAGYWAEYEGVLKTYDPADSTNFEIQTMIIKIEIIEVQKVNIIFNVTYSYPDGTNNVRTMKGELGQSNFEGFVIPANLIVGDTFKEEENSYTIIGTEEQKICQETRQVVYANIIPMQGMKAYWDKTTGIITESIRETDLVFYNLKMADTNIW